MRGFVYASALLAATAVAPVFAVSIDGHQLPEPQWQMEEPHKEKISLQDSQQKSGQKPALGNHTDSLLQRQMRQLEKLRRQAERDRARAKKLQQLKEES